jgi:hypothetical protein
MKKVDIDVNSKIKKLLDKNVSVRSEIEGKEGKVVGVADNGDILLKGKGEDEEKSVSFEDIGEVHFVDKNGTKVLTPVSESRARHIGKKMSLIQMFTRTLNETTDPFKTDDIKEIPGVRGILEGGDFNEMNRQDEPADNFDVEDSDTKKLIDQYKYTKLSGDALRDAIGDDLEQLDYNPEDVNKMINRIVAAIQLSQADEDPIAQRNADERYGPKE